MRAPATIRVAETTETKALSEKAHATLRDESILDSDADAQIAEINRQLLAAGMPSGAQIITRAQWRAV